MRLTRLTWVPVVLAAAGCLQGQRLIKVKANGSGTIVDTVQAQGMMAAMAEMDKSSPAEKKAKKETKLKERAAAMGPGVTLVSYQAPAKNGPEVITYAFTDITKIKVDATPDSSENDAKPDASEQGERLTFKLAKAGGRNVLTVMGAGPKPGKKADAKPEDKAAKEAAAQMQAGAMAMMKTMMKGLKMSTVVEVEGSLVKTNSPHAQGSRVTLLDIDFDQLAADEASFKKFSEMGDDPKKFDAAALKGIKGVKVSTEPETTIEFQ